MTESERKLDVLLSGETWPGERTIRDLVRGIISEIRAEVLEEAAMVAQEETGGWVASRIRALITTPVPASIPVEKVRGVLVRNRNAVLVAHHDLTSESIIDDIASALGVSLDGGQGATACDMCACGEPRRHHDNAGRIVKFNGGNTLTLCSGFRKVAP